MKNIIVKAAVLFFLTLIFWACMPPTTKADNQSSDLIYIGGNKDVKVYTKNYNGYRIFVAVGEYSNKTVSISTH